MFSDVPFPLSILLDSLSVWDMCVHEFVCLFVHIRISLVVVVKICDMSGGAGASRACHVACYCRSHKPFIVSLIRCSEMYFCTVSERFIVNWTMSLENVINIFKQKKNVVSFTYLDMWKT